MGWPSVSDTWARVVAAQALGNGFVIVSWGKDIHPGHGWRCQQEMGRSSGVGYGAIRILVSRISAMLPADEYERAYIYYSGCREHV